MCFLLFHESVRLWVFYIKTMCVMWASLLFESLVLFCTYFARKQFLVASDWLVQVPVSVSNFLTSTRSYVKDLRWVVSFSKLCWPHSYQLRNIASVTSNSPRHKSINTATFLQAYSVSQSYTELRRTIKNLYFCHAACLVAWLYTSLSYLIKFVVKSSAIVYLSHKQVN